MGTNLFVCKLPNDITDRFLLGLFTEFGEVISSKIVRDSQTNKSKGFAFVRIAERDAENAIQHLNGKVIKGQKIVVKYDTKS